MTPKQVAFTKLVGLLLVSSFVGLVITIVLYTYPYRTVTYSGPKTCNQAAPTYAMTFVPAQHNAIPLKGEAKAYCQGTARYAGFPITEHGRLIAHNGQLIDDQAYVRSMFVDWIFWWALLFIAGLLKTKLLHHRKV